VPGGGFYKDFKDVGGVDYFDARGYITTHVAKIIDIAFGYDKNFIGNGHRSLFLSDFSSNMLFLKLNTRIWKFNYQNLFMELTSGNRLGADNLFPKKYAAMHHLDVAVTKWLNLGLFEGVVFGRKNYFEFGYLNPVIFTVLWSNKAAVLITQLQDWISKQMLLRNFNFMDSFYWMNLAG